MLKAEQIDTNWKELMVLLNEFNDPRKNQLINLFKHFEDRLTMLPHSYKPNYVGMYPGGWAEHLIKVINTVFKLNKLWEELGVTKTYTESELFFSALVYDIYKLGTKNEPMYLKNTNDWEIKNRNLLYVYNDKLQYINNVDRTILLLNEFNINYSENELLAIRLHAGLNDENNKQYFHSFIPEARLRTSLVYILSQGIEMTDRILFEQEFFPKFTENKIKLPMKTSKKQEVKEQILNKINSNSIKESLKSFL